MISKGSWRGYACFEIADSASSTAADRKYTLRANDSEGKNSKTLFIYNGGTSTLYLVNDADCTGVSNATHLVPACMAMPLEFPAETVYVSVLSATAGKVAGSEGI